MREGSRAADLIDDTFVAAQANEDGFEQLQRHSMDLLLEAQYCVHPLLVQLLCTGVCTGAIYKALPCKGDGM